MNAQPHFVRGEPKAGGETASATHSVARRVLFSIPLGGGFAGCVGE